MIDFEFFQKEYPEYEIAWTALQLWLTKHWDQGCVNLRFLSQTLDKVPALDLVLSLNTLIDHGKMQTFYKLVCDGEATAEEYSEPDKIPLTGETADCDILIYFRWIF